MGKNTQKASCIFDVYMIHKFIKECMLSEENDIKMIVYILCTYDA